MTNLESNDHEIDPRPTKAQIDAEIAEMDFDKPIETDSALIWWSALVGPFLLTLVALGVIGLTQGWVVAGSYVAAAGTAFFLLGRFVILLGSETPDANAFAFLKHLDASHLFYMLTWMDVMVAIFVACHMSILFRLPWAGAKMEELVDDAKFILMRQPWINSISFLGLVLFVIFPTSTTGSIGGSIFGRLLGLNRLTTVIAILIGSVLGNGVMLVFARQVKELFPGGDNLWFKIFGVLGMVFALFLFERWVKHQKHKYLLETTQADSPSDHRSP